MCRIFTFETKFKIYRFTDNLFSTAMDEFKGAVMQLLKTKQLEEKQFARLTDVEFAQYSSQFSVQKSCCAIFEGKFE